MLIGKKPNKVYELEKKMIEKKFVIGKVDEKGEIDITEKNMYDYTFEVYEEGRKSKKISWFWGFVIFLGGLIVGGAAGVITLLLLLKK
jgi:hypothetical protein